MHEYVQKSTSTTLPRSPVAEYSGKTAVTRSPSAREWEDPKVSFAEL